MLRFPGVSISALFDFGLIVCSGYHFLSCRMNSSVPDLDPQDVMGTKISPDFVETLDPRGFPIVVNNLFWSTWDDFEGAWAVTVGR